MNDTLETMRNGFLRDVVGLLVEHRKKQGISQEELNDRLGVADRLLGKWEAGSRQPTAFNLYCWADALELKLTVISQNSEAPKLAVVQEKEPIIGDPRSISLNLTFNAPA